MTKFKSWPYTKAAAVGAAIIGGLDVANALKSGSTVSPANAAISGAITGGILGIVVDFIVKNI